MDIRLIDKKLKEVGVYRYPLKTLEYTGDKLYTYDDTVFEVYVPEVRRIEYAEDEPMHWNINFNNHEAILVRLKVSMSIAYSTKATVYFKDEVSERSPPLFEDKALCKKFGEIASYCIYPEDFAKLLKQIVKYQKKVITD